MSVCTGATGADCNDGGQCAAARRRRETITAAPSTVFGRRPHGQTPGGHIQGGRLRQLGVRVVHGPDQLERQRCRRADHLTDARTVVQQTDQEKYLPSLRSVMDALWRGTLRPTPCTRRPSLTCLSVFVTRVRQHVVVV